MLDIDDKEGSYVENKVTKERLLLYLSDHNRFCFVVQYPNGTEGSITLDSGAGASVWPNKLHRKEPLLTQAEGMRLIAANGTEIANYGRAAIKFRGIRCDPKTGTNSLDFPRLP